MTMSISGPLRAVIVDDEASARERVRAALQALGDVDVVAECADGDAAVAYILAHEPDLVLLDVQMPGLDGFGVVQRVGTARMPPVVFTSGYAEHAVRAFEACAIDYVLKPFDDARLCAAVARVRTQILARAAAQLASNGDVGSTDPRVRLLLDVLAKQSKPRLHPDALVVRVGGAFEVVRVNEVVWVEADGNYAQLHVAGRTRLVSRSLAALERDLLDPARFARVHRSAIVNVGKIQKIEPLFHGDLLLVLEGGARVTCSRRYRERLEELLYFTT